MCDCILMRIVPLTCRCGARSVREEEFTNLSLDLVPGVSVQQLLQDYQTVRTSCSLAHIDTDRREAHQSAKHFTLLLCLFWCFVSGT